MNDHNKNIAARLTKLASAASTGSIPIAGPTAGAVYFRDGDITYAESDRTPKSARPAGAWPSRPAGAWPPEPLEVAADQAQRPASEPVIGEVAALAEATVDAALDLLSSRSACGRFRTGATAPISTMLRISVADLLAEVTRRRRLLGQLTGITADTTVARNPQFGHQRVQVSALQWALLIRVQAGATPRDLAWALGRSVFGTTAEVHRLMTLGLVTATGSLVAATGGFGPNAERTGVTLGTAARAGTASYDAPFMRALSEEKGGRGLPARSRAALRRQAGA